MDSDVIQKNPEKGTDVTGEPDLEWLTLDDDEEIKWASTSHKNSLIPAGIVSIPLMFLLIGFITFATAYFVYKNRAYVVTTKGVYSKEGVLSENVKQVELSKIQNTSYSEGVIGGALGYGNVEISTAGSSGVELTFYAIPNARNVRQLVSKIADLSKGSDSHDGEAKADVLDDILVELQEIRKSLAENNSHSVPTETTQNRTDMEDRTNSVGSEASNTISDIPQGEQENTNNDSRETLTDDIFDNE